MNSFSETLNHWGGNFLHVAWPMLWQSSALIVVVLAFEFLLRRQLRASIRYALWLVVLIKLILPPTLALPTSPAWWFHETPPPPVKISAPKFTVTYDQTPLLEMTSSPLSVFIPPPPVLIFSAWLLITSIVVSIALLLWLLLRWWQTSRQVNRANISERLTVLAGEVQQRARMKFKSPTVKITANTMSPAVCGLFRPVILIPQSLATEFSDDQLRAVLLHELIHLRRRDVWVNFLQSLLQIVYWWHPLVWVANARIRRVREEAVDDAVMLALGGTAEIYAPTLLEVAKLALNRPLASLGLVGILESRSALRQRIERLVNFNAPRKAGLTLVSFLGILVFSAVAVPMGEGPSSTGESISVAPTVAMPMTIKPSANPPSVVIQAVIYQMRPVDLEKITSDLNPDWTNASNAANFRRIDDYLKSTGLQPLQRPRILTPSGKAAQFYVGNETNSIEFECQPFVTNGLIAVTSRFQTILTSVTTTVTNQFEKKFTLENRGGILLSQKNYLSASNVVLVTISAEIVTNVPPSNAIGVMADTNFLAALHMLQQRNGIEKLNEPEVVHMKNPLHHANAMDPSVESALLEKLARTNPVSVVGVVDAKTTATISPLFDRVIQNIGQTSTNSNPLPTKSVVLGQKAINDLIHTVRLKNLEFDKVPLSVALTNLAQAIAASNPSKATVLFVASTNLDSVTVSLRLADVLVKNVLDAIVLVAEHPPDRHIQYSVGNQGVKFSWMESDLSELKERVFRLNKTDLISNMRLQNGALHEGNVNVAAAARNLFTKMGIDWDSPSGKSVFYDDEKDILHVKATKKDLDTIEQAIQTSNKDVLFVHIKTSFFETPKGTLDALKTIITLENQSVEADQTASQIGVLTPANLEAALNVLKTKPDVEELSEPEDVVISGRSVQAQATTIIRVLTNAIPNTDYTNYPMPSSIIQGPAHIQMDKFAEYKEIGPKLRMTPYIMSDNHAISLPSTLTFTEFLGYDPTTNTASGQHSPPMLTPIFRILKSNARINLLDGQTLIIGRAIPDASQYFSEKSTDDPSLASHYFEDQTKDGYQKDLIIFVTATVVDLSGNRIR